MKNINKFFNKLCPPLAHAQWPKSLGYVDFKMATNKNALIQPKFELGICGIHLNPSLNVSVTNHIKI